MGSVPITSSMWLPLAVGLTAGYLLGGARHFGGEARAAALDVESVARLSSAVEALGEATGKLDSVVAPQPVGDGVGMDWASTASMADALGSMQQTLEGAHRQLETIAEVLVRSQAARAPLELPAAPVADEVFAKLQSQNEIERRLALHGWSHRQVAGTYGAPDELVIDRDGGAERWYYDRSGLGKFIFQFNGDRLVQVTVP